MKDSPLKRLSATPLEEVITERDFAQLLQIQAQMFFRFGNTLLNKPKVEWGRQDFFQLITEADSVEALLDDHGARYNRTFCFLRELVASLRGIALTGFSLAHLERRIESYGATLSARDSDAAVASLKTCKTFVMDAIGDLFLALHKEAFARGLHITSDTFPEGRYHPDVPRRKLPRNMGQQELESDEQKIAEVASKFLQACGMFEEISVQRIENEHQREAFLQRLCTEERARVYEATVHNLQSTYDTYVKNTVLEAKDENLPKLRGHISAALHLLEAVTHLAHFVERHERAAEKESVDRRIAALVRRSDVRDITLNHLLYWAVQFMTSGRSLAEKLLASYTNVLVLQVEVDEDVTLHARPAALIVGIVNRYGTPVEMEIDGHTCNAASILDLLVTVGSHPQARRYTFRGDENPLRDIQLLFENGLGEAGFDRLPPSLSYLRSLGA